MPKLLVVLFISAIFSFASFAFSVLVYTTFPSGLGIYVTPSGIFTFPFCASILTPPVLLWSEFNLSTFAGFYAPSFAISFVISFAFSANCLVESVMFF